MLFYIIGSLKYTYTFLNLKYIDKQKNTSVFY